MIPVKASLLLASMSNPFDETSSCLYEDKMPVIKRPSKALGVIRWWLLPLAIMIYIWVTLCSPSTIKSIWFKQTLFDLEHLKDNTISKAIPVPMPEDMLESYDYAVIADRAIQASKSHNQVEVDKNIAAMNKLTDRDDITMKQIKQIRVEIEKFVNEKSLS